MKRHSDKALYNTTIKQLLNTRYYKGETPYIFAYYTYEKGIYNFVFIPEKDKDKNILYDNVRASVCVLYWQYLSDYKNTFSLIGETWDRCETIAA